jgi:ferredoxin
MCPQVFSMDKDEIAEAQDTVVPLNAEVSCRDAAQQCPVEAIKITE